MPAKPSTAGRAGRLAIRAALGLALLLALLGAGHALAWRWLGARLEEGLAAWAAARRAEGWQVEHGAPLRGGWPFAATLALPEFRLRGGGATVPGGVEWQAESVVLRIALPRPGRLLVDLPGRNHLRLGEAGFPFAAERLRLAMPIEREALPSEAALEAERLRLGTAHGALELGRLQAELDTRLGAAAGEPAVALRGRAGEVALPPGLAAAPAVAMLGPVVQELGFDLALTGPAPPGRHPAARAEAWRAGGGTLALHGLALRWGPVTANAAATLTLDEALQPMGAGALRLAGGAQAIEAAAAAGLVSPRSAATAQLMLRLMQRIPPEGGPPQLDVPLTLEGRVLSLARFPLLRLPGWAFPAAAGN